jgi:hypothetical protein
MSDVLFLTTSSFFRSLRVRRPGTLCRGNAKESMLHARAEGSRVRPRTDFAEHEALILVELNPPHGPF